MIALDRSDPEKSFVFVDGGMTPYNNPSFLLYRMATLQEYRLGWPIGEKNLLLVSVGTGAAPTSAGDVADPGRNIASNLAGLPSALMYAAQVDQDINCRTVGRCVWGAPIDSEMHDLIPGLVDGPDLGRAFRYARYNAELSRKGARRPRLQKARPRQGRPARRHRPDPRSARDRPPGRRRNRHPTLWRVRRMPVPEAFREAVEKAMAAGRPGDQDRAGQADQRRGGSGAAAAWLERESRHAVPHAGAALARHGDACGGRRSARK